MNVRMMNIRFRQIPQLLLAVLVLSGQDAMAAKVYQWTDGEGVVHFSDTPPEDSTSTEIKEIEFVDYAMRDTDPDEYSIINQLKRLAEWRKQVEEERIARKQLQLEAKRLAQEKNSYRLYDSISSPSYYMPSYSYSYPAYYPYPGFFGGNHKWHGHHGPGHHSGAGKANTRFISRVVN